MTDPGFDVQLTPAEVEVLLGRPDGALDAARPESLPTGSILITGAGGSLGALVLKDCWRAGARVIGLDRAEAGLFRLALELAEGAHPEAPKLLVRDAGCASLTQVLQDNEVRIIVHAAAHKHVGLMEADEAEAQRNNVEVTRALHQMAAAAGVEDFLLLSTDKAVAPISAMGRSKAAAEALVLAAKDEKMRSRVLRLPNVLGTAGSVVQVFRRALLLNQELRLRSAQATRLYLGPQEALSLVRAAVHWRGRGLLVPATPIAIATETLAARAHQLWGGSGPLRCRDEGLGAGERQQETLASITARKLTRPGPAGLSLIEESP